MLHFDSVLSGHAETLGDLTSLKPGCMTALGCATQAAATPASPAAPRSGTVTTRARSPAVAAATAAVAGGEAGEAGGKLAAALEAGGHWVGLNRLVHRSHLTLKLPPRPSAGACLLRRLLVATLDVGCPCPHCHLLCCSGACIAYGCGPAYSKHMSCTAGMQHRG